MKVLEDYGNIVTSSSYLMVGSTAILAYICLKGKRMLL
jgi:hypothetical protein